MQSSLKPSSPYHFQQEMPPNSNMHLGTEASCVHVGFWTPELSRSLKRTTSCPSWLACLLADMGCEVSRMGWTYIL